MAQKEGRKLAQKQSLRRTLINHWVLMFILSLICWSKELLFLSQYLTFSKREWNLYLIGSVPFKIAIFARRPWQTLMTSCIISRKSRSHQCYLIMWPYKQHDSFSYAIFRNKQTVKKHIWSKNKFFFHRTLSFIHE